MAKKKAAADKRQAGNKYPVVALRPPDDVRAEISRLAEEEHRTSAQMALVLVLEAIKARKERKQ